GQDVLADRRELLEQRLVDVEPPRRVEDERREPARRRFLARPAADGERRLRRTADDGHAELPPERLELVLRRRTVGVGGGEQRVLTLLRIPACELRGGRRLARALEPDEHDHGRRMRRRG